MLRMSTTQMAVGAVVRIHSPATTHRSNVSTGSGRTLPTRRSSPQNGNLQDPIHRWFRLKEAFSSQLLRRILSDTGLVNRKRLRILDPFAGVGTTAISAADAVLAGDLASPTVYGVECNAFLHLVASTKFAVVQRPPDGFLSLARRVAAMALQQDSHPPPPGLTTFQNPDYFAAQDVTTLVRLREAIQSVRAAGCDELAADLCVVCLGAIVEPVCNLRRDGRALRHVQKSARPEPVEAFLAKADEVADDLPDNPADATGRILRGDGRTLDVLDNRFAPFDLVVFSPPYPNNIDYTEVYKLENWLLGYIRTREQFQSHRLRTVYSHPSLLRANIWPPGRCSTEDQAAITKLSQPVLEAVPDDRYSVGRKRMIQGYLADMLITLRASADRLKPGGWLAYVVGNSVHGRGENQFLIGADLLMAELAERAGLAVDAITVARRSGRRQSTLPFLRESIVLARKPPSGG